MAEPPVVTINYDPEAEPPISVDTDPVMVPKGVFDLVWLRGAQTVPWRIVSLGFEPSRTIFNRSFNNRVATVTNRNLTDQDAGSIKYSITIFDEKNEVELTLDPQIVNEEGGGMEEPDGPTGRRGPY